MRGDRLLFFSSELRLQGYFSQQGIIVTRKPQQPPHSEEAEQSVLGALLLDATTGWDVVADRLSADDFFQQRHRIIFECIALLMNEGKACDYITVGQRLTDQGRIDSVGGPVYLVDLATDTPGATNLETYARIVREMSIRRDLIRACQESAQTCFSPEGLDGGEIMDLAEQRIFSIRERRERGSGGFQTFGDLARGVAEHLEQIKNDPSLRVGVPTGFTDLDKLCAGMRPGHLVIVAGRPSMGKTALAVNLLTEAGVRAQLPVAMFSMEMTANEVATRILSSTCDIPLDRLTRGELKDEDWASLVHGPLNPHETLANAPIYIDEEPALTTLELRAKARRLKARHGLALLVVDYIQLMRSARRTDNRVQEVSEISRDLKSLAKELNVPVLALSQLSRAVEQRENKRPQMSDLRESGSIEQDADMILMLYRDEYYNPDSPDRGIAEAILAKHRNGPTGTIKLSFQGRVSRFANLAPSVRGYMDLPEAGSSRYEHPLHTGHFDDQPHRTQ